MNIAIDVDRESFEVTDREGTRQFSLFSPEAFRILSRQWLILGWNLHHYFSFSFMGRHLVQFPDDVLRLGEMIWRLRPDVILETGVYDGGSTLFWATLCRMQGHGRVISIDHQFRPGVREAIQQAAGDMVTLIEGDAASPELAAQVGRLIRPGERVCVHLDSDHSAKHVSAELELWGALVTPGCYLVVADSNLVDVAHTPRGRAFGMKHGPDEAVNAFVATHPEFLRERPRPLFAEDHYDFTELSYCADTWLKRVGPLPAPLSVPKAARGDAAAQICAWHRDFVNALATYRGQRAWKVMLAVRKVYDVLARGNWKQRLSLLGWIPAFLLGRSSGLEEYELQFPDPAAYLNTDAYGDAGSAVRKLSHAREVN